MTTNLKLKLVGLFTTIGIAMFSLPVAGSPAAGASHQVPEHMEGGWAIRWSGGTEHLRLYDSRFEFYFDHFAAGTAHGRVSVSGHTITFHRSNVCTGTGAYDWSQSKRGLRFVQVAGSSDPCPRAPILAKGTWTHR
ncbi:MAG: hypothetical protein ACTHQQ_03030 [Solirubrobacteraceae bacterium]